MSQPQKRLRSRNGCINCRNRKKKCDEVKPICSGCFKRNIKCEYKPLKNERNRLLLRDNNGQDEVFEYLSCDRNALGDVVMEIIQSCKDLPIISNDLLSFLKLDDPLLDELSIINEFMNPKPYDSLQIKLPILLNSRELYYLEYYCKEILPDLSLLPQEFNHYSRIYFPIAFKSKFVLYCLILWGSKHLNGSNDMSYHIENKEITAYTNLILEEIKRNISRSDTLNKDDFLSSFVSCMLLVCMEASFGDTQNWSLYFLDSFYLLNKMPGQFKYLLNECDYGSVLAQNFAYFDVLASQSNENGTYYEISEYSNVFTGHDLLDPLQGCIKPLILKIGKIITLLVKFEKLNNDSDLNKSDKMNELNDLLIETDSLEAEIKCSKPGLSYINTSQNSKDLEFHLTLFEIYQISTQLYLKQVLKRHSPVVPEIRVVYFNLKQNLNIILLKISEYKLFRRSLAFPMLILGICCCDEEDRKEVELMFTKLIQNCGYLSSYYKLWIVVQKIWEINEMGKIYVDWFMITKKLGWKISLGR